MQPSHVGEPSSSTEADACSIWAADNLHIWELANLDLKERTPTERAELLTKFRIRHYAYLGMTDPYGQQPNINTSQLDIDAEIQAMKAHGIDIRAWYFWLNGDNPAEDPTILQALDAFTRHRILPQIWVPQSMSKSSVNLSNPDSADGFPTTASDQRQRVRREARRIAAFSRLAAPHGCKVNLYNHQGWFGLIENQLEILDELRAQGISDVGLVYNIGHSYSSHHDDARSFADLWSRMEAHVVAVNVVIFGHREIGMMRVIQESGWKGPVGILARVGNAEFGIPNALWTIGWAASRVREFSSSLGPVRNQASPGR